MLNTNWSVQAEMENGIVTGFTVVHEEPKAVAPGDAQAARATAPDTGRTTGGRSGRVSGTSSEQAFGQPVRARR